MCALTLLISPPRPSSVPHFRDHNIPTTETISTVLMVPTDLYSCLLQLGTVVHVALYFLYVTGGNYPYFFWIYCNSYLSLLHLLVTIDDKNLK